LQSGWDDPEGVFESDFDDSLDESSRPGGGSVVDTVRSSVAEATSTGGLLGYFRGNVSYTVLGLMWVTFLFQYLLFPAVGINGPPFADPLWRATFVLTGANPEFVWTWITSILSHGGFGHIVFNSIALYFFGPVVERRLGSRRFLALFAVAGVFAGFAQIGIGLFQGVSTGVLGASGAIMAVMGVLTVLRPGMKVYLYFVLPVPLWLLTFGFAGFSVISGFSSVGGGGVASRSGSRTALV
jgi:hypothetical protein